ncbi:TonB-dependent receptor [Caulobacter mirabilis]|uniref:TonB-dependent receptor n=1 Tax=Caulobacter mirabilis TaxID=69666 RepID=UPI001FE80851|nr:TonB-dependent receptor [Caulobacter mirabilis]
MAASPALAADEPKATDVEAVVITGIRASLQEALESKRKADQVVEVITAEDIGKFPDMNVADSLGRVTGVNVVTGSAAAGGFGENERIAIRGTDPNLNLTLLNGHGVATGDWFVLDQTSGGRSFNFSMLPSELVGRMEVIKSAQANIPEGGVGGTVNVHTRNPLDLPAFTVNMSAQGAYASRPDKWTPQLSGMISWKNDAATLGILVGLFYEAREFRRDGQEFLGYGDVPNFAGTGQTVKVPNLIGWSYFTQERIRKGGNFAIQWEPSDRAALTLSGLYTKMDADNVNVNSMLWGSWLVGNAMSALTSYTIKDGYLTAASWGPMAGATPVRGRVQDDIFRTAHSTSWFLNLDGRYELTDRLSVSGQIGYAEGEGVTSDSAAWETYWHTGASYEFKGKRADVSYPQLPSDPTSPAYLNNFFGWSWGGKVESPDTEFYAKGDVDYQVDEGSVRSMHFGARYTDHTRELTNTAYAWAGNGINSGASTVDLGSVYKGDQTPSNYFDGIGPGIRYSLANRQAVFDLLNSTHGGRQFAFYPPASFAVSEKTAAVYAMANLGGDRWRGNIGVRAVHTSQETTQYSGQAPVLTIDNVFGRFGKIETSRDYWDILPSANIAFDLTDDIILRGSAAKVMSRPGYAQLAGAVSLIETTLTGTAGGNPSLDPFRAKQFNLGAEWYYGKEALLALNFFYLDIESYVTMSDPYPEVHRTPQNPNGATFRMQRPINGGGGTNKGFEISLQQPVAYGFGFIVNYTYADAKTDAGAPIDGNSKNTYNLTGYFENDWLSARLAYNFRSKFKSGNDRGSDMWQDDIGSLDASISVSVSDNVALTFDAQNLTDQQLYYYVDNPNIPRAVYDNGRTFYVGARAKF